MAEKFEINLLEENEIEFQLKIEGSDVDNSKPKIRFTITEHDSGKGWIFNTEKKDKNGNFVVSIPKMKGLVSESKKYDGKLEIIMGSKYFAPTEVDIEFTEPLKVEAVVANSNNRSTNDELLIESIIVKKQKPSSYNDLTNEDKAEVNALFLVKCNKIGIKNPTKALKEGSSDLKKKLKGLIVESVDQFINNKY